MRNESWIRSFDDALHAQGLAAPDRAELVVEIEGFLDEGATMALDHFGAPDVYAASIIELHHPTRRPSPDGPALLAATGLHKGFRGRTVLDDVAVQARAGEIVAVIGANGSGKSTLLRALADIDPADRGSIAIAGSIGYAPQSGGLDERLTPVEHFELFGGTRGLSRAAARAEGLRLAHDLAWEADGAPLAGELSGGTRRKLAVITALIGGPDVVLLDEPCQGFDGASNRCFWDVLSDWVVDGRAAVVASHLPDVVHRATTVLEIGEVAVR
ncbi:MAG: ATP-binding cassette domain-containing protein [Actinomycetota bacterium]